MFRPGSGESEQSLGSVCADRVGGGLGQAGAEQGRPGRAFGDREGVVASHGDAIRPDPSDQRRDRVRVEDE